MKKIASAITIVALAATMLAGCNSAPKLKDGTYSAQIAEATAADTGHGWQETVTIAVVDGKATVLTFDGLNLETNMLKSMDPEYAATMTGKGGPAPADFYAQLITNWDKAEGNPDKVDVVTGATNSSNNFKSLMKAALTAAEKGDAEMQIVE